MGRIISGIYKGHRLYMPPGKSTRPSSDRFKESLFNVLGGSFDGMRWLDAFAGSGQMGLEALSRGAAEVVFVEADRRAVSVIERNLASLRLEDSEQIKLFPCRLEQAIPRFVEQSMRFDYIYLDPPWQREKAYARLEESLLRGELLKPRTRIVTESESSHHCLFAEVATTLGYSTLFERVYGAARLTVYGRAESASNEEESI